MSGSAAMPPDRSRQEVCVPVISLLAAYVFIAKQKKGRREQDEKMETRGKKERKRRPKERKLQKDAGTKTTAHLPLRLVSNHLQRDLVKSQDPSRHGTTGIPLRVVRNLPAKSCGWAIAVTSPAAMPSMSLTIASFGYGNLS